MQNYFIFFWLIPLTLKTEVPTKYSETLCIQVPTVGGELATNTLMFSRGGHEHVFLIPIQPSLITSAIQFYLPFVLLPRVFYIYNSFELSCQ